MKQFILSFLLIYLVLSMISCAAVMYGKKVTVSSTETGESITIGEQGIEALVIEKDGVKVEIQNNEGS